MARIRTIKPEFWTDEAVAECSPSARLLFVATWNLADDYGNLQRSSKQLKAQVFPYDKFDVEPLVVELLNAQLLVEYQVEGKTFLHIKSFRKHQKIDKPSAPRCPLFEDSASIPRALATEGKGREGKGKGSLNPLPPFDASTVPGLNPAVWDSWQSYRAAIRKPLKPVSLEAAAKQLAAYGHLQQQVVEQSIANQWTGLFPLKQQQASGPMGKGDPRLAINRTFDPAAYRRNLNPDDAI